MRDGLPALPLYRVRFRQKEVWPDYAGNGEDVLEVEIFQHWLETPMSDQGQLPTAELLPADGSQPARAAGGEGHPHRRAGRRGGRGHAQRARPSAARKSWRARGWTTVSRSGCWRTAPRPARSSASTCPRSSCSRSRTPPRCTTPSSARCAPATRACCSASRRSGTSRATTARGWCASRARCWRNSACSIPEQIADPRARFHRRHALYRASHAPRRHRGLERGAPGRARQPRLHDRRCCSEGPQRLTSGAPSNSSPRGGTARRLRCLRGVLHHARPRRQQRRAAPRPGDPEAQRALGARRRAGAWRTGAALRSGPCGVSGQAARRSARAGERLHEARARRQGQSGKRSRAAGVLRAGVRARPEGSGEEGRGVTRRSGEPPCSRANTAC